MGKKILMTTVYREKGDRYDYFTANTHKTVLTFSTPQIHSYGLKFLKQNFPEIDILEFPTWDEFASVVGQYDIVGFSFLLYETPGILKMVECARKAGVKEIWGGNYGIITEEIQDRFDRVFLGYSEREISEILGVELNGIKHPIIVNYVALPFGLKISRNGILFTSRGCFMECTFCQTPTVSKTMEALPMASIEQVLRAYKDMGIKVLVVQDENFGSLVEHTEMVTEALNKYGFHWICMTRPDILKKNMGKWSERGMFGVMVGIESFNKDSLKTVNKRVATDTIEDVLSQLKERGMFIVGFYMIGMYNDTAETIRCDIRKLAEYRLDVNQICITTPLPQTPLWREIETGYGIFETDYGKFDTKNLVWNHPCIKPEEMKQLLIWASRKTYTSRRVLETSLKFARRRWRDDGVIKGSISLMREVVRANRFDYLNCDYEHCLP